jgi:hypothetical protein
MGVCGAYHHIPLDFGMSYLAYDIFVRESYNQSVLRCVVLIFVLGDQALSSIVISFAFSSTFEFNLETFKIGSVFDDLDVPLKNKVFVSETS